MERGDEKQMEMVKEIAIFLIVVNILSSLMPNKNYQKYLKVLSGIVLILIILEPLQIFFDSTKLEELVERNLNESNIVELNQSLSGVNEEIGKQAKEMYEQEIADSISKYLVQQGIEINQITVEMEINQEDALELKEVVISLKDESYKLEEAEESGNRIPETRKQYVKNLVAENYGIETDRILVEE